MDKLVTHGPDKKETERLVFELGEKLSRVFYGVDPHISTSVLCCIAIASLKAMRDTGDPKCARKFAKSLFREVRDLLVRS